MSYQITKVDLIPNGEIVTCNVSQFDNGRVLPFEIYENGEVYNIPSGITVELHCRKPDGNIVTLPSDSINDNIVNFISTTQLTACYGKNVCEIALYGPDEYLIGSANFILDVEKSPTLGGITSTSEIHNLEEQIEEITTEIIGEDYYNKTEVDNKLDLKANASDVYTKNQVDSALALKANAADVYTKTQTDTALATKADKSDTYTKEQVDALIYNIFPVKTASGAIANFTTGLTYPLVSVTASEGTTTVTRCGVNLFDKTNTADGYIDDATGEITGGAYYQHTDYIPVVGGQKVYIMTDQTSARWGAWYDENKTYISGITNYTQTEATAPNNARYIRLTCKTSDTGNLDTFGVNYPSTVTSYHEYNGQTVPVSDATTLVTQSGVNNVFADVGDVTVRYKYMSI